MNILIVGSGAREHALAWKISQSRRVKRVYCAPGNPGISAHAECLPIQPLDIAGLKKIARERGIDLTVVGPEQPLSAGIVDEFTAEGLRIFGPTKGAAMLEWSKSFAKDFMRRHHIPTAKYKVFLSNQQRDAKAYLASCSYPVVVKVDGLAAGKGVLICDTEQQAHDALADIWERKAFGDSGSTVVLEEFMVGQEASIFALCDGNEYITLAPAQDHKRALDGDKGRNTGGMGAYAPAPIVTPDLLATVSNRIIAPTVKGMAIEGNPYKGCLYVGIMITADGPKVVEYNSRFGDPETQVILPLVTHDFLDLLLAACDGTVKSLPPNAGHSSGAAVSVVIASSGYPGPYETGHHIRGLESVDQNEGLCIFHAGTRYEGDRVVTAGGRVLSITAVDKAGSFERSIQKAYEAVGKISFTDMYYRHDIAKRAIG